jgi:hypothetical protein
LEGVWAWGPEGAACYGVDWGLYDFDCHDINLLPVATCTGQAGVQGVKFWGPRGLSCAGQIGWSEYIGTPMRLGTSVRRSGQK